MPLHLTLLPPMISGTSTTFIEEFLIILKIVYWKQIPLLLIEKNLKFWSHDIFTSGHGFMHGGCFLQFLKKFKGNKKIIFWMDMKNGLPKSLQKWFWPQREMLKSLDSPMIENTDPFHLTYICRLKG